MSDKKNTIIQLSDCWDYESGFFGRLRQGVFDDELFEKTVEILKQLSFDDEDEYLPKDAVSLIWIIPLFMGWQKDRVSATIDMNNYAKKSTIIENEVMRILGVP
jgi:hypothetical protein